MADFTHVPGYVPVFNPLILRLLRIGVPVGPMTLLTVRGLASGQPRTTPFRLFEQGGRRWLLATFGETNWTRNLRAAGEGILGRGRHREVVAAVELLPEVAGSVLKEVLGPRLKSPLQAAFLRRFYALTADSSTTDFIHEAQRPSDLRAAAVTDQVRRSALWLPKFRHLPPRQHIASSGSPWLSLRLPS